jgi:hypothetical protein
MRISRYLVPGLLALLMLALPTAAGAVIVPQRGMLGVNLGMTAAQIRARIGPPDAIRRPTNEIFGRYTEYRYGEVRVSLFDSNGQAFNFFTRGKSARTVRGVGVGSTEAFLKANVTGETCRTQFGIRSCVIGRETAGQIVTAFSISRTTGRVTAVTIGRVID